MPLIMETMRAAGAALMHEAEVPSLAASAARAAVEAIDEGADNSKLKALEAFRFASDVAQRLGKDMFVIQMRADYAVLDNYCRTHPVDDSSPAPREIFAPWRPGSPGVTAAELADVLASHPVVVFHFWANWNTVDRSFEPTLAALRREFQDQIAFRSVDVDDPALRSFCLDCEVANVPVLALFVAGRRVKTLVGVRAEEELRTELQRLLNRTSNPGSQ